jgi:hypothetical protein
VTEEPVELEEKGLVGSAVQAVWQQHFVGKVESSGQLG